MDLLINPSKISCGYNSKNKRVVVAKWVAEAWEIKTKKEMAIRAFKKCDITTEESGSENYLVLFEEINYVISQPEEEFHLETSSDENSNSSSSAHDAMPSSDEVNEITLESYYFVVHFLSI